MAETTTQVTLDVPGINCGHCESRIQTAVSALSGVSRVEPSNVTKTVNIEFEPARYRSSQPHVAG